MKGANKSSAALGKIFASEGAESLAVCIYVPEDSMHSPLARPDSAAAWCLDMQGSGGSGRPHGCNPRTEEKKGPQSVQYGVRRLTQIRTWNADSICILAIRES